MDLYASDAYWLNYMELVIVKIGQEGILMS